MLRTGLKRFAESMIGYQIKRVGPESIALIPSGGAADAWFSYDMQLRWLIESQRINLIVDVGANNGQFAEHLRHLYKGDILSFEPVATAFANLQAAAASAPNWRVHQVALGSTSSIGVMHVARDTIFSSLLPVNAYSVGQFDQSVTLREEVVTIRRLDDVLNELVSGLPDRRILLKMDTQGYDLEVFNGLGACLPLVRAVLSEVSLIPIYDGMPHWTDTVECYERAGFRVVGMFPVTRDHGRVIEYDCLLVADDQSR